MTWLEPPRAGADPEDDRHGRQRLRATLEKRTRLTRGLPAHVDPGDLDPVREPAGRACEGEAQHHGREGGQHGDDRRPLHQDHALLGARPRTAAPRTGPGEIFAGQARPESLASALACPGAFSWVSDALQRHGRPSSHAEAAQKVNSSIPPLTLRPTPVM